MSKKIDLTPIFRITGIYIAAAFFFSIIRLFLFLYNKSPRVPIDGKKFVEIFIWGIRYDFVPLTYILIITFVLLLIHRFSGQKMWKKIALVWTWIMTVLLMVLYFADIVYYKKFAVHLNTQFLYWLNDFSTVLKMLISSPDMIFIIIPALIFFVIWWFVLKKIFFLDKTFLAKKTHLGYGAYFIFLIAVFFIGKGRIIGHSLSTQYAYNDDRFVLNDFKINAFFTLRESWKMWKNKTELNLTDNSEAVRYVQKQFGIDRPKYNSPIARDYFFSDSIVSKPNVVIIFMERKAAWKMKYFGNKEHLMPFLDSLFVNALSFDRFYSAGTRTYEGLFGTLYGYPVLFDEHPFYGGAVDERSQLTPGNIQKFYGMPQVFQDLGYHTVFFIPHTGRFDNVGMFFYQNGFKEIHTESSYDKKLIRSNWGIDDHSLFEFALDRLDRLHRQKKNFFAAILTITDHEPYMAPDFIKGKTPRHRAIKYADWSLKKFFEKARTKPWFDRTIFILLGDHGKPYQTIYSVELSVHHIPLIIYHSHIKPQIIHTLGDQKDVLPTIMDLLDLNYTDNTFGKNLLARQKSYAYFNHYEKNAVLSEKYMLVINKKGEILGLYDYPNHQTKNLKNRFPALTDSLSTLLKSHLQASYYIRKNNWQAKPIPLKN